MALDIKMATPAQLAAPKQIPRRIVQSWVNRHLTQGMLALMKSHTRLNPGYEYVFYDDQECREFIEKSVHPTVLLAYDAMTTAAFKADLFRYCELYVNGGWWFDIDTLSVGSIEAVVPPATQFACAKDFEEPFGDDQRHALYQAVLGSAPRHPILERAIRRICYNVSLGRRAASLGALNVAGPLLLGSAVNTVFGRRPGTRLTCGIKGEGRLLIGESNTGGKICMNGRVLAIGHSQSSLDCTATQRRIEHEYAKLRKHVSQSGSKSAEDVQHWSVCDPAAWIKEKISRRIPDQKTAVWCLLDAAS